MGKKTGFKRNRDRELDIISESQGMSVVKHTPEAALDEAERRAADWLFPTDSSHDVPMSVDKAKFRLVLDISTSWDAPPYQSHEQVMKTIESFVLKQLACHKYLQFNGIVARMETIDD